MKVTLENVRLAFGQGVFEARAGNDDGTGDKKFSSKFLLKPGHKGIKVMNDAIEKVAREKWPKDWEKILKGLRATDKVAIHDGDNKPQWEGFEGMQYVNASSTNRPTTVDRNRNPVTKEDGTIYSGCYVYAYIEVWAQDHPKHGKRVNSSLRGVQFFADGDSFAGAPPPAADSEMADLSADDETIE